MKHTLERPFKCDQCTWGFVTMTNLKKHMNSKHTPAEKKEAEKKYLCHQCPGRFSNPTTLATHLEKKRCGRKVGVTRKSELAAANRSTKKRKQNVKASQVEVFPQEDVPASDPASTLVAPLTEENLQQPGNNYYSLEEDSVVESNCLPESADDSSMGDIVVSRVDLSLKNRVIEIFRGQLKSGILMLLKTQVLNPSDLIKIVLLADRANLKTAEFIEAIIRSVPDQ